MMGSSQKNSSITGIAATTGTELTVHQICFKEYKKDPSTTEMTDTAGTDLQYIRYALGNISLLLLLLLLLIIIIIIFNDNSNYFNHF